MIEVINIVQLEEEAFVVDVVVVVVVVVSYGYDCFYTYYSNNDILQIMMIMLEYMVYDVMYLYLGNDYHYDDHDHE